MRRPERLAEALREEIIEIVGFELVDPRVQSVTVTEVQVSDNLRDAKVFVIVAGDEAEIKDALNALHHAASYIRQQVTLSLNLNHAPRIHFIRDTVEEKAIRIEELLEKLEIEKEDDSSE